MGECYMGGGADKSNGLTATASDIGLGKTALVDGNIITGALVPKQVASGVVQGNNTLSISFSPGFVPTGFVLFIEPVSGSSVGTSTTVAVKYLGGSHASTYWGGTGSLYHISTETIAAGTTCTITQTQATAYFRAINYRWVAWKD